MDDRGFRRPAPALEARVDACLHGLGLDVRAAGRGRWRVRGPGDRARGTAVVVEGDWLVVERPIDGRHGPRGRDFLRWAWAPLLEAPTRPAGARTVLRAGDARPRLRAECPPARRSGDGGLARWIESALAGTAAVPCAPAGSCEPGASAGLEALCREVGWPLLPPGADGAIVVELPGRDGRPCHARSFPPGDAAAGFRVRLDAGDGRDTTPAGRAAVAVALLRAAGGVRLVRATAAHRDARLEAALDVPLHPPLEVEGVADALSALGAAHRHVAAEVRALACDDALARAYLAVQAVR